MIRILVAFGSKRQGTAGLATMIGDALTEAGCDVSVAPARGIRTLTEFDAVVVAGALYANRWHRDARSFVRANTESLRKIPVWLVSSGPLDDSAARRSIAPTAQVTKLVKRVNARGHITFGGRLAPDARGFPASAMAKTKAGDWRDEAQVNRWATSIVEQLRPAGEAGPQPA